MNFLHKLLAYDRICLQCHDNPDADTVAAAFGVYRFLVSQGRRAQIFYGGNRPMDKSAMKLLVQECGIPIAHVSCLPDCDLLVMVDCQFGLGNAQAFSAERCMVIDHHILSMPETEDVYVRSEYQSCSTLVYDLLRDAGYDVSGDEDLSVALLYGLYTDTSCFADLFRERDSRMKLELFRDQPLFERLVKSNMTQLELMVASHAMQYHYSDPEHRFALVEAIQCDQAVLGIIGDFMIQVDAYDLTFTYTRSHTGYQISLRTCGEGMSARDIAAFVCRGIGTGGGHFRKAGGFIDAELLQRECGDKPVFDVILQRLRDWFAQREE